MNIALMNELKMIVERMGIDVWEVGQAYGLELVGLCYFDVFGTWQDPEGPYAAVIRLWFRSLALGEPAYVNGDGETSRDFCHVENAAQADLLAAVTPDADALGQFGNVAVGDRTMLNELFALIRAEVSRARPERPRPGRPTAASALTEGRPGAERVQHRGEFVVEGALPAFWTNSRRTSLGTWHGCRPLSALLRSVAVTRSTRWLEAGWRSRRTQWVEVRGFSMAPALAAGDWIRVAPLVGRPSAGQTVVFLRGGRLVAHRVAAVDGDAVVTRGDARASADAGVPLEDVLGRVVDVRRSVWSRVRAWMGGTRWQTTA